YTQVAEFHYLHHDVSGKPYNNLAEHGERLIAAAKEAGIKITLLPMFYQKGGFGQAPQDRQRRFISKTIDDYYALLESSAKACKVYNGANLGYGIHSLRAVDCSDIKAVLSNKDLRGPFHIHIAEQLKEIEDSITFQGKRPVEWLADNVEMSANYHLVHATHLTDQEVQSIASSGARVVLCPSTEGNLGDGIFPLRRFQELGGKWSIGTDSHVGLNPCEELRLLDYGQRLTTHKRNTFVSQNQNDSGHYGFDQALISGRAAMGNSNENYFKEGQHFDAMVYDCNVPLLATSDKESWLSTIIYSSDTSWNLGTIVNGEWVVKSNHHEREHVIKENFIRTLKKLAIR
ncbi:MAG: amidohydrolase family protein, partial [Fulvivirga sp.]|uniref:amidohydrolase family protein n=1 Tax=Fulvivirga sp. TaxID=1931237 RepID=UPI0032EE5A3E